MSLLRKTRYSASPAAAAPSLQAWAKPPLRSRATMVTSSSQAPKRSTVPSEDASSTTITLISQRSGG